MVRREMPEWNSKTKPDSAQRTEVETSRGPWRTGNILVGKTSDSTSAEPFVDNRSLPPTGRATPEPSGSR
jgi:hypothetical protein